jgi:CRISPR system Cascade subunit CasA
MNLTIEPWIPVVWADGKPGTVSLREAFERGHEIQDLAVRPHERIALMRLLICIAQAALDGPGDFDDWKSSDQRIAPAALDYLKRWNNAFDLFGDAQRFLQIVNLTKSKKRSNEDEDNSTSKLDLALATGNNTTLFDNSGGSERSFAPDALALMLLTFQCFSPGGRIGVSLWNGRETPGEGSSEHAPCLAGGMLHTLVRGGNLLETLNRNLISKQQVAQLFGEAAWGRPVWERMPSGPTDTVSVDNACHTYLGRLVPLTRAIWLAEDCRSVILANGLDYPSYSEAGWREPTATIVTGTVIGQPTRMVLPASIDKAVWRELHALTVKAVGQAVGGPVALQNLSDAEAFDLWVGALVAKKAKLVDLTESVFHIPAAMLTEPSQVIYEKGVQLAEGTAFRLMRAVSVYHKEFGDNLDRPEMKNRRKQIQHNAAVQFWTDVESAVPRLLEVAAAPEILGLKVEWYKTPWGKSLGRASRAAFEQACPHETVRQMRAYVLGLRAMFTKSAEQPEDEIEKEV